MMTEDAYLLPNNTLLSVLNLSLLHANRSKEYYLSLVHYDRVLRDSSKTETEVKITLNDFKGLIGHALVT